jgi:hypothetical protein
VVPPLPPNATFLDIAAGLARGRGVGAITFTPDFTQAGSYQFLVVASDGTLADTIQVIFVVTEFGNHAPVIAPLADRTVNEADTLRVTVTSSDLDGDIAELWAGTLPANAAFADLANGTGSFLFVPDHFQAGVFTVTFFAADAEDTTSIDLSITVIEVNQLPFVNEGEPRVDMFEMDTVTYATSGYDLDGHTPYLSAHLSGLTTLATNMSFVDHRNGTGTLTFMPDWTQGAPSASPTRYNVIFRVTDSLYPTVFQESAPVVFRVTDRNKLPELVFPLPGGPGPYILAEGEFLRFYIGVLDEDAVTAPALIALDVPATNATFVYNSASRIAEFEFAPSFTQSGVYAVRFIATDDRGGRDTAIVSITVLEAGNQAPSFGTDLPDTLMVPSGHVYEIAVTPTDPESDSMTVTASPMLPGATWTEQSDGTWIYAFTADSTEIGAIYEISFVVTDYPSAASATLVTHPRIVAFLRGDLDSDNVYSVNDIAYFVEYLFREGPAPGIPDVADIDANGHVSISDVSYLIYYMFRNGPQPAP